MAAHLAARAGAAGFGFLAPPVVNLVADASIRAGGVEVESTPPAQTGGAGDLPADEQRSPSEPRSDLTMRLPALGQIGILDFGGWQAPLRQGATTIGRGDECDLVVPARQISRRHAELRWTGKGFRLRDLGSTNGTFVGQRRIDAPTDVAFGDRIAFGPVEAVLIPPAGA
jgi:hypothetical protein